MKKIHSGYLKSVLLWVIVFVLTLVVSMGGAYAYFTATATKKQATATTGIIRVKFDEPDPEKGVICGDFVVNNTSIVPGSTVYCSGTVINDGTVDMWAVLECSVYVDDMETSVQTEFYEVNDSHYDSNGGKLLGAGKIKYNSTAEELKRFETSATEIAFQRSKDFTIEFTFSTTYNNDYLNKSAKIVVIAHAIQKSHVGGVEATNLLLQGKEPVLPNI